MCVLSHKDRSGEKKTSFLDTEPTNSVFAKLVFQLKGLLVSLREVLSEISLEVNERPYSYHIERFKNNLYFHV